MVDRAGRRTLFRKCSLMSVLVESADPAVVSTGGMCLSYVFWTICSAIYSQSATNLDAAGNPIGANDAAGRGVLAFIFIYYAFYNIAFAPLLALYTIEITPFRTRAKYITIGSLSINCALVFVSLPLLLEGSLNALTTQNQYVNSIAIGVLGWRYYIVYCCWLAFEFVVLYFSIIETVGKNGPLPLEVTNFLFDGDDKAARLEQHGRDAALAGGTVPDGDSKDEEALGMPNKVGAEDQHVEHVPAAGK